MLPQVANGHAITREVRARVPSRRIIAPPLTNAPATAIRIDASPSGCDITGNHEDCECRTVQPRRLSTAAHDTVPRSGGGGGAQALSVYNHMLVPLVYESWEADYPHLLERVQLWDVSVERQVESRGRDALALVELMTPRGIARCAVGQCMYAPLVDEHGGIVSDPLILRLAGDRFWVSVADSDVLLWAKGLAAGEGLRRRRARAGRVAARVAGTPRE